MYATFSAGSDYIRLTYTQCGSQNWFLYIIHLVKQLFIKISISSRPGVTGINIISTLNTSLCQLQHFWILKFEGTLRSISHTTRWYVFVSPDTSYMTLGVDKGTLYITAEIVKIYWVYQFKLRGKSCCLMCWHIAIRGPFYWHRFTHLPLDKMAAISPKIFSDAFSWVKSFVYFQLTITHHWFR